MAKTQFKPRPPGTLKQAVARLIDAAGGQTRAADFTRVSNSQMFRYCDDGHPDHHMPVDIVRALELHAGRPIVSEFLAAEAGYALVPLLIGEGGSLAPQSARCAQEASEVFARLFAALADGRLSPQEAGRAVEDCDEVLSAFATLRAMAAVTRDG